TTGRQAREVAPDETNESLFVAFLREAGVTLREGGTSNEIAVDQVVFQKRIQRQLQKSPRYPGIVQEFINGLETHIEDPERFRNCLLPCVPRLPDEDSRQSFFQIFFFYCLIFINFFSWSVPYSTGDGGLNIPRVIINQLKWQDRVMDSKELAAKLMQLVSVAPVEVQRDIITSLPEILEDSQHNDVARELNSLLQENTQLTVPILDALSSLNLSSSLLTEVRGAVMAMLAAVHLEDLPVVVKFILHSVSASDANEVVCDLHKKLELEMCVLPPVLHASHSRMKSKGAAVSSATPAAGSSQDSVTLILDGIKSAVRFQKTISEAWLKVMDLLVLFILHSTNSNHSRRGAERVLKAKVRTGQIQEALLQKTFRDYSQVMRGYFPSILALAQSLLRSTDSCAVPFGGHMYRNSFTAFDSYCQQEVVGSLVTHVCSGVGGEVDVALELLCGLVTDKPSEMALYAVFVKGILDYMDNLTPQQIRKLFHLLSRLAFGQQQQGTHIQDDLHIVIRKQLSSTVPKYKRIGIIGAVMEHIQELGAGGQVVALLELVQSCSKSSPEAAALYYDELANLILSSTLDPKVQEWIGRNVLDDFQNDFVVDLGPDITGSFLFPARVMYNLDEDEGQGGIAVNLLPLLARDSQQRVSPLCLSPFFRLLRLCEEKQHQGDLEEIDALLGCPLVITDMDIIEKVDSLSKAEREFLCSLLFHTINWLREVVNAFCRQKETEMKIKVMTRLQNITYLQTLLERALAGTPGYIPPLANFDGESTEGVVHSSAAPVHKTKKGKKRKAPQKSLSDSVLEEGTEADETQQVNKEKEKEVRQGVSLVSYQPFFRELDMEVLSVLQCGLLSRSLLDSELHTKVREEVLLGPAELVFLLEDMLRKLEFSLTAAPAKRAPFLKSVGFSHLQQSSSKDIASCCVQLLPALCSHLENCHNHFQTLLSENGGMVDGPATDIQEYQLLSLAYQLLLQVVNTTFSWSGFSQPGQRSLLKKALAVLAGRLKQGGAELALEHLLTVNTFYHHEHCFCICEQTTEILNCNVYLFFLLSFVCSIYLEHADDVLKAVEEIAGEGIPELLNAAKDDSSTTWPTLSRHTFLVFYKGMMSELEKAVRKIPKSHYRVKAPCTVDPYLSRAIEPVFDTRLVLNVCLKYGRLFLESFLKLGMPLLDYSFKRHKEDVQSLLKTFQLSTRQLHHMCGHSKIHQDTSLTNHVPALKKSLEQFVYRVKVMLTLNNCQEAFWMGNLKNRDLKGQEILSQEGEEKEDEEEEEGEDASEPPEEQTDDEVRAVLRIPN
uniref:FA complementation group D2 n=1 Tax=Myripristis murdjan TaxID=586833 RepID=A0A667XEY6_9TELE